jgi:hypothetical protein
VTVWPKVVAVTIAVNSAAWTERERNRVDTRFIIERNSAELSAL